MYTFAKGSSHAFGQKDGRFTVFVPQSVRGRKGLLPFFPAVVVQQFHLLRPFLEVRGMDTQQTHGTSTLEIVMKQSAGRLKDLDIHLRRLGQGMSASDGVKIRVAKLQLDGAGGKILLPQPAPHKLR